MSKRRDNLATVWDLAPHTRAKHKLLEQYLGAWFPMLTKYQGRVVVLDGFAGPGVYAGGEPGSPQIVLTTLLDHSHFDRMSSEFLLVFNEQDDERFASLEDVIGRLNEARGLPDNVQVIIENESFPELAEDILEALDGQNLAPTFAFLDPFGYRDVPMELIKRLLVFDRCELFIYFDFNSVNRFSTAGNVDEHFLALFGTDEFMQAPPAGDPDRGPFLHDLYDRQLREEAGFEYVQSFEMINAGGRTGNYLFFCTRRLEGLDKMKQAMWKVAPSGDFRFYDRYVDQESLFDQEDVDTTELQDRLVERFSGQTVSIDAVLEFTVAETPYASNHVKNRTLKPMEVTEPPGIMVDRPGRNGFPQGTMITFL
jgi:three-Cys-motif partner protein